jgi:hypothetical protein
MSAPPDSPVELKDARISLFEDPLTTRLVAGEFSLAIVTRVEDIKVHPGQAGQLQITNIRLIWFLPRSPNVNASIGYRTIQTSSVSNSVQSGASLTEVLFLKCKEGYATYEFIFGAARSDPSVFRFFTIAYENYVNSSVLREQKLRSSIVLDGNVALLPDEQVMLTLDGLSNFAGETAKVGKAIVTNFRFVWYSGIVSNFNVSIPLILLPPLKSTRSARYGRALYLKFNSGHSNFLYGFTISPEEKLKDFTRNFEKIRQAAIRMPRLTPPLDAKQRVVRVHEIQAEEDLVIVDPNPAVRYLPCDLVGRAQGGAVVFDKSLGLAIESLPEGETLSERWRTASTTPLVGIDEM